SPQTNGQGKPLPAALTPLIEYPTPHWVIWKWETSKQGKRTKVPYQARNPRRKASTKDPSTWATYAEAVAAKGADGIGFVLTGTDFEAFDIDDCRDAKTGTLHSWASNLIAQAGSYAEVTVSGTGVRIIGRGNGPELHRKLRVTDGVTCEFYRKATRYIVVAGNQIGDAPIKSIDAVMDATLAELDHERPGTPSDGGHHARQDADDDDDKLQWTIRTGGNVPVTKRSEKVYYVVNAMLRLGYITETIVKTLLDRKNGISAPIYDQSQPQRNSRQQITNATKKIELTIDEKTRKPYLTQNNIRIALLKLGVSVRYDLFADRTLLDGLEGFGPTLDDAALIRIRLTMERRFKLLPSKDMLFDIVRDVAQLNSFHPVRNYYDSLKWDGVKRLDKWLSTYGGADDNLYTNAVGALMLTATVRRVRQPGCKFDEMVVLENEEQGTNKSTTLQTLAVKDEWFSDSFNLSAKDREAIEQMRGHLI